MKRVLFLIVAILSIVGCTPSEFENEVGIQLENNDFLLFGVYAGDCVGDCVDIYRLTQIDLMRDTTNQYPFNSGFFIGTYQMMPQQHFLAMQELLDVFPTMLLERENATIFGCPDCADQGGFYVEIKKNTIHKKFYLDTQIVSNPNFLQVFVDKLGKKINLLNP